jgi:3-hydroxyacyl-CoA dehydrogenase
MVNEAAQILEEGIARRASDIDLVEIHGYGFPRWRGGLMHYAQARGIRDVLETVQSLADNGLSRPPCPLLERSAKSGSWERSA